ncbi:MAG TPA: caspase family protein [Blastocatellia bacterium]|nr:caspase family protein [Blastocatellia bacterium]
MRFLALLPLLLFPDLAAGFPTHFDPQAYDIYYLAVGNTYYGTEGGGEGFKDLEGANRSARKVSALFDRSGAAAGITLVSEKERRVTKADVLKALNDLISRVRRLPGRHPLIIFYFCGHGVSEGVGWNHFSIPGNFAVPKERINIDTLGDAAIYAGEVSDMIESHKLAGMLLLDACYEGTPVTLLDTVISQQLAKNLTDVFKVLRYENEFHGPTIAVYSTAPGTVVPTVQDPEDPDSPLSVGPLARRLMIIYGQSFKGQASLTIGELLRKVSASSFDRATPSVVSLSKPEHPDAQLIKFPLSATAAAEARVGTGSPPKREAIEAKAQTSSRRPALAFKYNILPSTFLSLDSEPNEYIGNGQKIRLTGQAAHLTVEEDTPNELVFSFRMDDMPWEMSFISPVGSPLTTGTYLKAQRAGFQDDSRSGFMVSGGGRGCSEVEAQFTILTVQRDQHGRLIQFDADFLQRCDGAASALRGEIRFRTTTVPEK